MAERERLATEFPSREREIIGGEEIFPSPLCAHARARERRREGVAEERGGGISSRRKNFRHEREEKRVRES